MAFSLRIFILFILLSGPLAIKPLYAQHILDKKITLNVESKPLHEVLNIISKAGRFYFSYNSTLIPEDSIIRIHATQKTVREILNSILGNGFEYRESSDYLIIQKATIVGNPFVISGYVINKITKEKIPNASVYESRHLATTLTNEHGYFQLRLRNRSPDIFLSVSKRSFNDTLYQLRSGDDQKLTLPISPIRTVLLDSVTITPTSKMESTWYGKFLLSSRQKIRDINLSKFFVNQPFQSSIWPGAGSHGKMSAQVVNKFSFNLLGGYSAGVNGVEIGGLFNIDKNEVQYVQIAGLFNTVGSSMKGVQIAGISNTVLDKTNGIQIAGISNISSNKANGIQIGGILNKAEEIKGLQIGGIENKSDTRSEGLQIAGIFNTTKELNGLQIGLINISDTSTGFSLGLINVVKKNGYYKLSLCWSSAQDFNLSFKSGSKKLYNILLTGMNTRDGNETFSLGYGLGKECPLSSHLSVLLEVSGQSFYISHVNNNPLLFQCQPSLQLQLGKKIALSAGPSFMAWFPGSSPLIHQPVSIPSHAVHLWNEAAAWVGAQAGITFF